MKKNIIASIASMTLVVNTIGINSTANAKVIEPEIVKTETWTTSYYIDDDMETLYPYIDCQADIYNDGTVKVYFWNTHEWDGFATVKHDVTIVGAGWQTFNLHDNNGVTSFDLNKQYMTYTATTQVINLEDSFKPYPFSISYLSNNYIFKNISKYSSNYIEGSQFDFYYKEILRYYNTLENYQGYAVNVIRYYGTLAELNVNDVHTLTIVPNEDIVDECSFRIFEHNFTITPDLLSGNVIAEPQISETEHKIKALEEENTKLKEENNNLQRVLASYGNRAYGDMNNDGFVDGRDASLLLTYYAKTSVGYTGTLDDLIQEQNKVEN